MPRNSRGDGQYSNESVAWRPRADLDVLRRRAQLLARIRAFFAQQGALEVETPLACAHGVTDPRLQNLRTRFTGPGSPRGRELHLQTSPEYAMKRLLAAGSGPIYQIGKAFRDGEAGRLHNPEFTLLEWYRPGYDHRALMQEVEALVRACVDPPFDAAPFERLSYRDAFLRFARIDPFTQSPAALAARARELGLDARLGDADPAWHDLLLSHAVEPRLGATQPCFLFDYPAAQAALARLRPGDPPVAERFELYWKGVELANGFHELNDAAEQRARFERDAHVRRQSGLAPAQADPRLLAALPHLPDCAGVALGVDRLLMLATGLDDVRDTLAFPIDLA